jgi:hypothetical protein
LKAALDRVPGLLVGRIEEGVAVLVADQRVEADQADGSHGSRIMLSASWISSGSP